MKQPLGQRNLGGASAQRDDSTGGVREHPLNIRRRADQVDDLLKVLLRLVVGEEEQPHRIAAAAWRRVLVRVRCIGLWSGSLIQLANQPLGQRNLGGGSAQRDGSSGGVRKYPLNIRRRADQVDDFLSVLPRLVVVR